MFPLSRQYYECAPKISEAVDLQAEAQGANGHHPFATEAARRRVWADAGVIRLTEPSCDIDLQALSKQPVRSRVFCLCIYSVQQLIHMRIAVHLSQLPKCMAAHPKRILSAS